jgi:hypothetical protein
MSCNCNSTLSSNDLVTHKLPRIPHVRCLERSSEYSVVLPYHLKDPAKIAVEDAGDVTTEEEGPDFYDSDCSI